MNWTLLHIKKTHFLKVQLVCLKAWGSIWGSDIKNVCLVCERKKITFDYFHGFFNFLYFWFFKFLSRTMDERRHKISQLSSSLVLFLRKRTSLGISCKLKSPSSCENWCFNFSFSARLSIHFHFVHLKKLRMHSF